MKISFFNFNGDFPVNFENLGGPFYVKSMYATPSRYHTNLSVGCLSALLVAAGNDSRTCVCRNAAGEIYVSRKGDKGRQLYKRPEGGVLVDENGNETPYKVRNAAEDGVNGTAIVCSLLPDWLRDQEAKEAFDKMLPDLQAGKPTDDEAFATRLALIGDNLYRRCDGMTKLADAGAAVIPKSEFPMDNDEIAQIPSVVTEEVEVLYGDISGHTDVFLNVKQPVPATETAPEAKRRRKARGKAALPVTCAYPAGTYEPDDEKMIPHLEGFVKPVWLERVENAIITTRKYREAMNVFAFLGPAGCGKSTASSALAEDLGMPEIKLTCHPDMGADEWFGSFNPNPAYTEGGTEPEYQFVEGALTKALRKGWLIEIQEVGVIRRPGAVAALNAVLEAGPGKYVDLPTGQRIYRDPKTIIIFTSNPGYLGTMEMNASVLSRLARVVRLPGATTKEMVARAKSAVPDFADDAILNRMAKTISDASRYMSEESISSGIAGQRELNNWCMEIMVEMALGATLEDKLVRQCAQETVVSKLAQSDEDIEEVTRAVIDRDWGIL